MLALRGGRAEAGSTLAQGAAAMLVSYLIAAAGFAKGAALGAALALAAKTVLDMQGKGRS